MARPKKIQDNQETQDTTDEVVYGVDIVQQEPEIDTNFKYIKVLQNYRPVCESGYLLQGEVYEIANIWGGMKTAEYMVVNGGAKFVDDITGRKNAVTVSVPIEVLLMEKKKKAVAQGKEPEGLTLDEIKDLIGRKA
jgi:hypothetical protein